MTIRHRIFLIAALCAGCAMAQTQPADTVGGSDVVGRVRTVQGPAFIVTAGDSVAAEIASLPEDISRLDLQAALPPGAARNAVD